MVDFGKLIAIERDEPRRRPKAKPRKRVSLDLELTQGQSQALDRMLGFARDNDPYFTLAGHAGTGKTTLTRFLAEHFPEGSVAFTAPTNKATRVLRETVETDHAFTIHSANGLMLMDDAEEKYLAKASQGKVSDYSLVVVDEASMIGASMFAEIQRAHERYGTKFLFVGDPLQLPPVKDGTHVAFALPGVELTQVVRQAEQNPIIRLAVFFRKLIRGEGADFAEMPRSPDGVDGVHFQQHGAFYDNLLATFCLENRQPDDVRAIAWRNVTVDALAARIRRTLYGDDVGDFVVGERVFAAKPYSSMYTDQEATITSVEAVDSHPDYPEIRAVPVGLKPDSDLEVFAFAVYHKDRPIFEKRCAAMRERAFKLKRSGGNFRGAWQALHAFNDAFADMRSVHALTAHRSQGSTFDEVFVDLADVRGCRDQETRHRLLYVACTRARRNVYLRE